MTLIKSISGIRGTIGGRTGDTLNPLDIVKFTTAYAQFIGGKKIVVGRDGRMSGLMVRNVVVGTLMGMGYEGAHNNVANHKTRDTAVAAYYDLLASNELCIGSGKLYNV